MALTFVVAFEILFAVHVIYKALNLFLHICLYYNISIN